MIPFRKLFMLYWCIWGCINNIINNTSVVCAAWVWGSITTIATKTNGLNAKKRGEQPSVVSKRKQSIVNVGGGGGGGGGGGFSRVKSKDMTMDDEKENTNDYAIFPALEPQVQGTCVTAANNPTMSTEIFQRLHQIYGFPHFNYETIPKKSERSKEETAEREELYNLEDLLQIPQPNSVSVTTTSRLQSDTTAISERIDYNTKIRKTTPAKAISRFVTQTKQNEQGTMDMSEILSILPPFSEIRVLHVDPLVLSIDNFFTPQECDHYIDVSLQHKSSKGRVIMSRSPTVGKDALAKAQRTSTTFYHLYQNVPELLAKASRLLGLSTIDQWEEPQTVRYRRKERFTWHLDALGPREQQQNSAGQRVATVLVYLTDLKDTEGGATIFRDLMVVNPNNTTTTTTTSLAVQPRKGSALLFFPAAGGIPNAPLDVRTLHAGQTVAEHSENDKWIAQLWLRQHPYQLPTAPPGNRHADATSAMTQYCSQQTKETVVAVRPNNRGCDTY